FKSVVTARYLGREIGVFQACVHDTHVAAQLGVANILAGMKARLTGTVVVIFQPAEEGPPPGEAGGASLMIAEGALRDPRPGLSLAFHANGVTAVAEGEDERRGRGTYSPSPSYAAATRWSARVLSRQAHGSTPHLSVDAAVTSSQIVLALETVWW